MLSFLLNILSLKAVSILLPGPPQVTGERESYHQGILICLIREEVEPQHSLRSLPAPDYFNFAVFAASYLFK